MLRMQWKSIRSLLLISASLQYVNCDGLKSPKKFSGADLSSRFTVKRNMFLETATNSNLGSVQVVSRLACVRLCTLEPACSAVNFRPADLTCELIQQVTEDDLTEAQGWYFIYDPRVVFTKG